MSRFYTVSCVECSWVEESVAHTDGTTLLNVLLTLWVPAKPQKAYSQPNGPAGVQCEFFGPISGLNFGR